MTKNDVAFCRQPVYNIIIILVRRLRMDGQTHTHNDFFALLCASLWGMPFSPSADLDVTAIRQELKHHAIQNLPAHILSNVDPDNAMFYLQQAAKACAHWDALMQLQQEVCTILEADEIPCAVIKGAAADYYYPIPTARNMGDIDIIVKPSDTKKAIISLLDHGFTLHNDRNPRHIELRKNGIQIEVHRHFSVLSDESRGARLDEMLFCALDRVEQKTIEGYAFFMLPKLENGLVLIEHINSHMESGLGLRQIIDWMLYVDAALDDDAWFGEFEAIVQSVGLEKLAVTVTRMCQLYLGLRRDITWCQVADESLCHRLMAHTMQQGNFGRKVDKQLNSTVKVLNILDSDLNFFQMLQKHGCYNWKALRKHPWLKPFAWIYQLCRYIRKGLKSKNPIRIVKSAFRRQKQHSDLFTELQIQRKDHTLDYDQ